MAMHVLNHHFWPDGSPSAVLEEQLADRLREKGHDTVLVAGSGKFHESERPRPASPIVRLGSGETGARRLQLQVLLDYARFWRAARRYVATQVKPGDTVVATSSPFLNVFLIGLLKRRHPDVVTVFHVHDYLPSNLRSVGPLHRAAAPVVRLLTDRALKRWDLVVLCAGNLAYHGPNARVARFWPTITRPEGRRMATGVKLALYAGNLGIAHDTAALVAEMNRLHAGGWTIDFYGDGPRLDALPSFVRRHGFVSGDDYLDVLYSHPVHLVAGTLGDGTGAFPSKAFNSLHIGAEVVPCGYAPELLAELEDVKAVPDLTQNLEDAAELISAFVAARRT